MLEIYVDADACPVKDEILKVADRHQLKVYMVANQWMRVSDNPGVEMVVVAEGFDAADDWIADRTGTNDIVVTADIPLAARALEKGARVIGPTGKPFTDDSIGTALAMRDLNAHLRDTGELRGGGPAFSKRDRSQFLQTLEQTIQAVKRGR